MFSKFNQVLAKSAIAVCLVAGLSMTNQSKATEVINLTAIDGYSSKSMWVREFINFYIPEINKGLAKTGNYKIKWKSRLKKYIYKI